jgi:hypothetical protein
MPKVLQSKTGIFRLCFGFVMSLILFYANERVAPFRPMHFVLESMDKDKTEGLWIGKLKHCKDKVGGIKWTDKPVKTLEIYFGHDKEEYEKLNCDCSDYMWYCVTALTICGIL